MQDKKLIWILTLAILSLTANFWAFPVYILDEAKNAACAMEMLQRGDWVMPTFNDQLRTDKPPLHYFFMMASYSVFGVSPFSARLFSVIMGLLTVITVYFFTKRMEGERIAFYSSFVLVSSLYFTLQFHLAVPDPYFIFFLTLCWLSFSYAIHSGRVVFFYVSYAAAALAFLAKGPAAVVLTGVVFLGFLIARRDLSVAMLKRVKLGAGILIFLVIAAPWWIAVAKATDGEWIRVFIWNHNVARFMEPYEDHGALPGVAILLFLAALLPLSVYLPTAVYRGWADRVGRPLILMCILCVGTVVLFFSISKTFLPNYVGPAIPFGAILIGYAIDRQLAGRPQQGLTLRIVAVGAVVFFSLLLGVLRWTITKDRWIGDLPELAWLFLPLVLGAMAALVCVFNGDVKRSLLAYMLGFWLTGILFFYVGVPKILARNPVVTSLPMIEESGREVLGYFFFNSAYVFAMQRPLKTFYTPEAIKSYSAGKRVIIVTRKNYEDELVGAGFKVVFEKPYLFEGSIALVLINEPF